METELDLDPEQQQMMESGFSRMQIDPRRSRFPCSIVWSPLPVISWFIPFIGHIGICREDGVILDFAGPNFVCVDNFAFGAATRYLQLPKDKCCIPLGQSAYKGEEHYMQDEAGGELRTWDDALLKSTQEFQHRSYSLFTCNCHSFVVKNLLSSSTLPITICATLLFLFVLFWLRRKTTITTGVAAKKTPPEVAGAWPLIGHLHLLDGSQPPHVTLGKLADKYGPIFTLRLGVHRTLVVSSYEMAKECFTVNDKAFASRPKSVAFEILGYNFSMFGFSPYGSYWRTMRKIATVHVLSTQRTETLLKHVMESEVKIAMKESYDFWVKMKNEGGSERAITEMKKWFGNIALNVMFRTVVGKRFDGDEEENQRIRKALRDLFDLTGSFVICDTLPYLRWLDLDGKEKEMKKTAKVLDEFVCVWLDQHKRNRKPAGGEHDFMDVLLSTVDDQDLDGRDSDTTIKATCLALILAGTDTTAGTLAWTLSLLLNNRQVLNKATQELDAQIGMENMAIKSDLTKIEYIQAISKETLRLYPPAPLNLPHESIEDCTVGGYHVPAGTRVLTNLSKLQRDPTLYSDPLEFRPERFLTTHKNVDVKGQHFELMPFGAGRRMCPGISFGLQLMQITLATLLHGFDIVTPDEGPVDMAEHNGLTTIRASPLQVILTPRLSAQAFS